MWAFSIKCMAEWATRYTMYLLALFQKKQTNKQKPKQNNNNNNMILKYLLVWWNIWLEAKAMLLTIFSGRCDFFGSLSAHLLNAAHGRLPRLELSWENWLDPCTVCSTIKKNLIKKLKLCNFLFHNKCGCVWVREGWELHWNHTVHWRLCKCS